MEVFIFVYRLLGQRYPTALIDDKRRVKTERAALYAEGKIAPHHPVPTIWKRGRGCDQKYQLTFRR